eukprot:202086_1
MGVKQSSEANQMGPDVHTEFICTNEQISKCPYLPRIVGNNIAFKDVVDAFLHLIDKHNDNQQFKYIYNKIYRSGCDISTCEAFKRNYRDRTHRTHISEQKNHELNELNYNEIAEKVKQEIIDKFHCYYFHSYDIGHRLECANVDLHVHRNKSKEDTESWNQYMTNKSVTELCKLLHKKRNESSQVKKVLNARVDRYNNLSQKNNTNQNDEKFNMYQYGYFFYYDGGYSPFHQFITWISQAKDQIMYKIPVVKTYPKYSNIKAEVSQNDYHNITIEMFAREYSKAHIYHISKYCKSKFSAGFELLHLLSLMLYCNFTDLQYEFSKTYRLNKGKDHCRFYHWGRLLTYAVHLHGTQMWRGKIKKLYHGVSQPLFINLFAPNMRGVNIGCPLSTSSAFEVAANFSNSNKGLIIELVDGRFFGKPNKSPMYFSAAWLSDFPSEHEYLFIQNTMNLSVNDILRPLSGKIYYDVIHALHRRNHRLHLFQLPPMNPDTVDSIIDELWICEIEQRQFDLGMDDYAMKLINMYLQSDIELFNMLKLIKCLYRLDYLVRTKIWSKWQFGTIHALIGIATQFSVWVVHPRGNYINVEEWADALVFPLMVFTMISLDVTSITFWWIFQQTLKWTGSVFMLAMFSSLQILVCDCSHSGRHLCFYGGLIVIEKCVSFLYLSLPSVPWNAFCYAMCGCIYCLLRIVEEMSDETLIIHHWVSFVCKWWKLIGFSYVFGGASIAFLYSLHPWLCYAMVFVIFVGRCIYHILRIVLE